jgi:hypothetical protein
MMRCIWILISKGFFGARSNQLRFSFEQRQEHADTMPLAAPVIPPFRFAAVEQGMLAEGGRGVMIGYHCSIRVDVKQSR